MKNIFLIVLFTGILFELIVFYLLPKQAWVDGLLQSWYFSQGLTIYKDSVSMYFPALYLLMVPFHKFFSFTQSPTIILALANSLLLFVVLTIFSFRNLRSWFFTIPPLSFLLWNFVLGGNQFTTPSFLNLVTFLTFICWWLWYEKPSRLWALLIGLFLSLTAFTVQIMALFAGIILASLFIRQVVGKKSLKLPVVTLVTLTVPIITIIIWLVNKNALGDFFYRAVLYYFLPGGYPYTMGRDFGNILMFLAIFSPAVLLLVYLCMSYKNEFKNIKNNFIYQRYIFSFLILLSFSIPFWLAIFHQSRFQSSLAITSFMLGLGLQLLFNKKWKNPVSMSVIGLTLILYILCVIDVVVPYFQTHLTYPPPKKVLTEVYPDDSMFTAVEWIKGNTARDTKLFATTDSLIYLETERLPVNVYATTNLPVVYTSLDMFKQKISEKAPDFWVIDERQWKRFEDFGYKEAGLLLQKILSCEQVVFQVDDITIRKHEAGKELCI